MSGVQGMRWGQGLPDGELEPCGTLAAYRRHYRRRQPIDESCRQAAARAWQDRAKSGWVRRRRIRRPRVHLAAAHSWAVCGVHRRRPASATGMLAEVTCARCLEVLRRHAADAVAIERRRSRAAA